ncbi:hypothetical protein ACF0H5_023203 [Mactra antiquata]
MTARVLKIHKAITGRNTRRGFFLLLIFSGLCLLYFKSYIYNMDYSSNLATRTNYLSPLKQMLNNSSSAILSQLSPAIQWKESSVYNQSTRNDGSQVVQTFDNVTKLRETLNKTKVDSQTYIQTKISTKSLDFAVTGVKVSTALSEETMGATKIDNVNIEKNTSKLNMNNLNVNSYQSENILSDSDTDKETKDTETKKTGVLNIHDLIKVGIDSVNSNLQVPTNERKDNSLPVDNSVVNNQSADKLPTKELSSKTLLTDKSSMGKFPADKTSVESYKVINPNPMKLVSYSSKVLQDRLHNKKTIIVPPEDLMKAGPFKFLPNYKNPCYVNPAAAKKPTAVPVLCLPYFFLVGAPKSGTTDMHRRLVQHHQISARLAKEPHWFTRKHYTTELRTLRHYQSEFLGNAIKEVVSKKNSNGYHDVVFGDCSASSLWDNHHLVSRRENTSSEDFYTNADVIHHLYPKTKIIIMVRDPVDRLYSDYLYFNHGTPQVFHERTIVGITHAQNCLKEFPIRHCLYTNRVLTAFDGLRLHIGIYYVHIMEYLRVFPRDQVMVIKLEDFSKNSEVYMKDVFNFLELEPLKEDTLQIIANPNRKANSRSRTDKIVGDMLPETRKLLRDFYRPFNTKLVELLGEKFNYNL